MKKTGRRGEKEIFSELWPIEILVIEEKSSSMNFLE